MAIKSGRNKSINPNAESWSDEQFSLQVIRLLLFVLVTLEVTYRHKTNANRIKIIPKQLNRAPANIVKL